PARPERPGRRGLDRPLEGALRHSRHARAADHRADPEPRLHPADQLGRGPARPDGAPRCGRDLPAMTARATHVLNRVLLAAIIGAILWFVLTVRTTSPPAEQAPAAAPP